MCVYDYIKGGEQVAAHGNREMPVWGNLFASLGHDQAVAQMRMSNLVTYMRGMRSK